MPKPAKSEAATSRKTSPRSNARRTAKRFAPKPRTTKKPASGAKASPARPGTKTAALIALIKRKEGATIADLTKAMNWQPHSVRGAISGTLKKKLGLDVTSEKTEGRGRVYRIASVR